MIKICLYKHFQSELRADFWRIGKLGSLAFQWISFRAAIRNIASQNGTAKWNLFRGCVFGSISGSWLKTTFPKIHLLAKINGADHFDAKITKLCLRLIRTTPFLTKKASMLLIRLDFASDTGNIPNVPKRHCPKIQFSTKINAAVTSPGKNDQNSFANH